MTLGLQESQKRKVDVLSPVQRSTQTSTTMLFYAKIVALTHSDVSRHPWMVFEVCTDESEKVGWFEDSDDWSSLSLHMERDGLKELLSKNKVMMKSSEVMHLARWLGI